MLSPKSKAEAIKKQLLVINDLLKLPENKYCADCKKTSPTWASVNLGVFICINCSGCHREIGVHITKVRSTNLDVWPKEILDNFKLINNKIANKYWEHKLKKFDFKKIQNDKYKLVEFIRNKYEHKNWIDSSKKDDPMTLISKGKIKKFKKLYCQDDEEEDEEVEEKTTKNKKKDKKIKKKDLSENEEEDEEEEKPRNKKPNKNDKNNKKKEESDNEEEEEGENDEESEEEEKNNKKNIQKPNSKKIQESKSPMTQRNPQMNNLFLNLNEPNSNNNNQPISQQQQNLLNLNQNNIMDLFNSGNNQSSNNIVRPQNNLNLNLNNNKNPNAYFTPEPVRSNGFENIFQQMPLNTKLDLQKNNTNMNLHMNNMNNMNNNNNNYIAVNKMNSMQNLNSLNNQMMNLNMNNNNNGMNFGMNNNNNFGNMNMGNNMNNFNFNNQNMNMNANNSQQMQNNTSNNINNNNNNNKPIAFNMDYFNKNMEAKKSTAGSTYNFKNKKADPFANLVSFKK